MPFLGMRLYVAKGEVLSSGHFCRMKSDYRVYRYPSLSLSVYHGFDRQESPALSGIQDSFQYTEDSALAGSTGEDVGFRYVDGGRG